MIIRGTTPTIKYTFSYIDPAEITEAYLTIAQDDTTVLEKELSDASVGEDCISWTLTQSETLTISNNAEVMLNYLLRDGTRGASLPAAVRFVHNLKEEVI